MWGYKTVHSDNLTIYPSATKLDQLNYDLNQSKTATFQHVEKSKFGNSG